MSKQPQMKQGYVKPQFRNDQETQNNQQTSVQKNIDQSQEQNQDKTQKRNKKKNKNNNQDQDQVKNEPEKIKKNQEKSKKQKKDLDQNDNQDQIYKKKQNKNKNKYNDSEESDQYYNAKDNLYPNHYRLDQVEEGIENKTLFKGQFFLNEHQNFFAAVRLEDNRRVLINNKIHQNRAIDKQLVVVKIKEKQNSTNQKNDEKENKNDKHDDKNDQKEDKNDKQDDKNVEDENSDDWISIDEQNEAENKKEEKIQKAEKKLVGEVVYLYENPFENKEIIGKLVKIPSKRQQDPNKYTSNKFDKKAHFFIPNQKKLPWMFIKEVDMKISENYEEMYFGGTFLKWPSYSKNPHVKITKLIGKSGNIEIECESLLRDNDVFTPDFTAECYEYLKKFKLNQKNEYIIDKKEREQRLDLTNELIFTIDPSTARDLDDALSIKHLKDDIYEIGVHIADVGHFVDEGTILDDEARLRTTSIYLTHRVIPMLPRLLCENLCSLNPNVERLTFSIFYKIKLDGTVIETDYKIAKSIIKSYFKMSYEQAQMIIQDDYENLPSEIQNHKQIHQNIKIMNQIAQNRRNFRKETGSLFIDNYKKYFTLDQDNNPIDFQIEKRVQSNFLVEEYMLLANKLVAKYMIKHCQEKCVIRNHEFPKVEKLNAFYDLCKQVGIEMDIYDSQSFQQQFESILTNDNLTEQQKEIIKFKMRNIIQPAKYLVVDQSPQELWHHFALNFDEYTHFTSPIRRYPDILVHRILFKILKHKDKVQDYIDKDHMIDIMQRCNQQKSSSRKVSDGCEKIFFCLYLKKSKVVASAVVLQSTNQHIIVLILGFSMEKKIMLKNFKSIQQDSISVKDDEINFIFQVQEKELKMVMKKYEEVEVLLSSNDKFPIDLEIKFVKRDDSNLYYTI